MANCFGLDEQPDESPSANPEPPGINLDGPIYGIPWPANRITYGQMRTLRQISMDVRLPITQLLKDAVDLYLIVLQREMQAVMVAEQEANREHGESEATNNEETASAPERPATQHRQVHLSAQTHERISPGCCRTRALRYD